MKNLRFKSLFVFIVSLAFFVSCCDDEDSVVAPSVTTATEAKNITPTTATSGGIVTSDGGSTITERGVCWSTSSNPTTANDKTTDGAELGNFTSNLTGLTASTVYYVRAYATNDFGTSYGNEITFTTLDKFVGGYLITKATLTTAINLAINGSPLPLTVPAGTDITQLIQQSLLSALTPCTPDKSLIELKDNHTMLMKCEGTTTEINAGTWEEVSATVLKLSMNSTAIPSSPLGLVLTVNNVTLENKKLSGDTSIPIPKATLAIIVTTMTGGLASLDLDATPIVLPVNFNIELLQN